MTDSVLIKTNSKFAAFTVTFSFICYRTKKELM
jgi:hypothetical protein